LNGHGSGEMKSSRPEDPRLTKLPRGISITTSSTCGAVLPRGNRLCFARRGAIDKVINWIGFYIHCRLHSSLA
jgi:hypothetical protein